MAPAAQAALAGEAVATGEVPSTEDNVAASDMAPAAQAAPELPAEPAALEPPVEPTASPAAIPGDGVINENELLARFERINAVPILPPEEGTAVIFSTRTPPAEPSNDFSSSRTTPEEPSLDFPGLPDVADPNWPPPQVEAAAAISEPEPAGETPRGAEPDVAQVAQDIIHVTLQDETSDTVAQAPAPVMAEAGVTSQTAPPPPEPPTAEPAVAEFDPDDFLFGPAPEPDPAAFLLDPALPVAKAGAHPLPQPEFVAVPVVPVAPPAAPAVQPADETVLAAEPAEPKPPAQPSAAPRDPLHALKAMSANERLAMFS
jgi:hypothetical protein